MPEDCEEGEGIQDVVGQEGQINRVLSALVMRSFNFTKQLKAVVDLSGK